MTRARWLSLSTAGVLLLAACDQPAPTDVRAPELRTPAVAPSLTTQRSESVYATGLASPRGLAFVANGDLLVAEAGTGGDRSTVGECPQLPAPGGPYKGGLTSRISRISGGTRTTFVDNLPSGIDQRGNKQGAADLAFLDGTLYALVSAGCSKGNPGHPSGVYRIGDDGSATVIADIGQFIHDNPVAHPEAEDFEPDGAPYSMIANDGRLVVAEANSGQLLSVTPAGAITRIADISASQGHIVPTAVVAHDGAFIVGNLSLGPFFPGSAKLFTVTPDGAVSLLHGGLSAVVGLTFDQAGRLYALELTTCPAFQPCFVTSGKVVRVLDDGSRVPVAVGLFAPTRMTLGPDGALYVSEFGFGPPGPNGGRVLRIDPNNQPPNVSDLRTFERGFVQSVLGLDGDLVQFFVRDLHDAGPWDVTVDWGDGQPAATQSVDHAGTLALLHSAHYAGSGTFTIKVTVKDPAGLEHSETGTITVP